MVIFCIIGVIFFSLLAIKSPSEEFLILRDFREDTIVKWLNKYSSKLDRKIFDRYNFFTSKGIKVKTFKLGDGNKITIKKNSILFTNGSSTIFIYKENNCWNFVSGDFFGDYTLLANALTTTSIIFESAYKDYIEENGLS